MNTRILIRIRQVTGALYIFLFLLIFLDFLHLVSPSFFKFVTYFQFIPSLLKFFNLFTLPATGFIVVALMTIFFGRIYCSAFCPLGIGMDLISRISKKLRIKEQFRYLNSMSLLRYSIMVIAIISLISGFLLPLNLLDPFSVFGKIATRLFQPAAIAINNFLAKVSEDTGNYMFYYLDIVKPETFSFAVSIFLLGSVTVLSLLNGRLYCNTVCPVGTFLGLISRKAVFRVSIDHDLCNYCHKCSTVCKSSCIDSNNIRIDYSRCIACFNCLESCSVSAIDFKAKLNLPYTQSEEDLKNRRYFLLWLPIAGIMMSKKLSARILPEIVDGTGGIEEEKPIRNFPVSPPGSICIERFNSLCITCDLCVSACPTKVLQPSWLEYGLAGIMQPRMNYAVNYCNYDCIVCGEVCPSGAIKKLNIKEKHKTQMGKVNLIWRLCIVFTEHKDCGACSEHCPSKSVEMVEWRHGLKRPIVDQDVCVGCGACEFMCPTIPYKAIYVDGNPVHEIAKPPKEVKTEDVFNPEDDFPF